MGDSASHRPFRRHSTSPDDRRAFADPSETAHIPVGGHHNENTELPPTRALAERHGLPPGATVLLRRRRADVLPVVVRTWSEWRILAAAGVLRPYVPRVLEARADRTVLVYVPGTPLGEEYPDGTPVDSALVRQLARLLARTCLVERTALPPLPLEHPRDRTDSRGFLRALVTTHHRRIVCANWGVYGGLFEALGVPPQALAEWGERLPELTPRPFSLLHGDLHRDNVIVTPDGQPPLVAIDWELATYGDPLHDLAIHLVRMRYPAGQWEEVVGAWIAEMLRMRRAAVAGVTNDLWYYLEFERAQSLFPDVLRTVRGLNAPFGQAELDRAAADVTRALRVAAEPLWLPRVPDEDRVAEVLEEWAGTGGGRVRVSRSPGRDTRPRVPWPRLAEDGSA
ncbi:phosphotransferase family protein [Streptomyces fumanus]|uniref:phosphotransferase family protein n=1 Tax=Streptomyces fumanus TaxID=67302 RepID=UPI0034027B21